MKDFDFGNWKGKTRPSITMSASEGQVLDWLQQIVVESAIEAEEKLNEDPVWPG